MSDDAVAPAAVPDEGGRSGRVAAIPAAVNG